MNMNMYTVSIEDLQSNANCATEVLLNKLEEDGHIKSAKAILEKYSIIAVKKGTLGKIMDKLLGLEDDRVYYKAVKLAN
jgi:hypothetical protein